MIVLRPRPPVEDAAAIALALALAARALTRPRKVLSNAAGKALTAGRIEAAGLDPRIRPGELSLDDWIRLTATC